MVSILFRGMNRSPIPDFAGLCAGGRAAEEQSFEGLAIPGVQRPEIAHASEGGSGENRQKQEDSTDAKSPQAAYGSGNQEEDTVDPQGVRKFQTGDGQGG